MKLNLLFIGLVAGPALAKPNKQTFDSEDILSTPDFDAIKRIPGVDDLIAQATQGGKSEQQVEKDIKEVMSSPEMLSMVADLQKKKARGETLDRLTDSGYDSFDGPIKSLVESARDKRQAQDDTNKPIIVNCAEYCVLLKTQQCNALTNPQVAVEECGKENIETNCKRICSK